MPRDATSIIGSHRQENENNSLRDQQLIPIKSSYLNGKDYPNTELRDSFRARAQEIEVKFTNDRSLANNFLLQALGLRQILERKILDDDELIDVIYSIQVTRDRLIRRNTSLAAPQYARPNKDQIRQAFKDEKSKNELLDRFFKNEAMLDVSSKIILLKSAILLGSRKACDELLSIIYQNYIKLNSNDFRRLIDDVKADALKGNPAANYFLALVFSGPGRVNADSIMSAMFGHAEFSQEVCADLAEKYYLSAALNSLPDHSNLTSEFYVEALVKSTAFLKNHYGVFATFADKVTLTQLYERYFDKLADPRIAFLLGCRYVGIDTEGERIDLTTCKDKLDFDAQIALYYFEYVLSCVDDRDRINKVWQRLFDIFMAGKGYLPQTPQLFFDLVKTFGGRQLDYGRLNLLYNCYSKNIENCEDAFTKLLFVLLETESTRPVFREWFKDHSNRLSLKVYAQLLGRSMQIENNSSVTNQQIFDGVLSTMPLKFAQLFVEGVIQHYRTAPDSVDEQDPTISISTPSRAG